MDQIDGAGEFAEVVGLFDGGIAAADDHQRPAAETRQAPSQTAQRADAAVLEPLFRGQAQVVGPAPVATMTARARSFVPSEAVRANGWRSNSTSMMSR